MKVKATILNNRSQGFRAGGIVVKDNKVLLMHQIVKGEDFYTLPGGSWEEGEKLEETCKREIKEEFNIDVKVGKLLFLLDTTTRIAFYFLCEYVQGDIKLGGPEKDRMHEGEQYYVEWVELNQIPSLNMIPKVAKDGLLKVLKGGTTLFMIGETDSRKIIPGQKVIYTWHPEVMLDPNEYKPTQVYGFCKTHENLVCLVRDEDEVRFTLPGGNIEGGELPQEALIREYKEEAQIELKNIELLGSLEVVMEEEGKSVVKTQQIRYMCEPVKLEEFVPCKDGWETMERIWVHYNDLPKYVSWIQSENGHQIFKCLCERIN